MRKSSSSEAVAVLKENLWLQKVLVKKTDRSSEKIIDVKK